MAENVTKYLDRAVKMRTQLEGPIGQLGNALEASYAPPSIDPFELVRNQVRSLNKNFDNIRVRWYKAQETVRKLSPLDVDFQQAQFELRYATENYIATAEDYIKALSGNRL